MIYYFNGGFFVDGIHDIPAVAVGINAEYHQELLTKQSQGMTIEPDENGYPVAVAPPPPTLEEKQRAIVNAIQRRLDAFAQTKGYDNILSVASYANSKNPVFAIEGQYAMEARDATWAKCYEILNAFLAGDIAEPTLQEIMAQLPILEWPVVTNE